MKEGLPVTWGFLMFIIITYIGTYIWNIQEDVDYYKGIAEKQKVIIEKQQQDIKDLTELTDIMMKYINTGQLNYNGLNNSPLHQPKINKPI